MYFFFLSESKFIIIKVTSVLSLHLCETKILHTALKGSPVDGGWSFIKFSTTPASLRHFLLVLILTQPEDVEDVDDVVCSRDTETRAGIRSECSHSYDH